MPVDSILSAASPLSGIMPRNDMMRAVTDAGIGDMQVLGKAHGAESMEPAGKSFGQMLQNAIGEVNHAQMHAGDLSKRFAAGEPIDVHQVMIASQEASVALNLAVQVRNKLVDGYQELMRASV